MGRIFNSHPIFVVVRNDPRYQSLPVREEDFFFAPLRGFPLAAAIAAALLRRAFLRAMARRRRFLRM